MTEVDYPVVTMHFHPDGYYVEVQNPMGLHQGKVKQMELAIRKKLRLLQSEFMAKAREEDKKRSAQTEEVKPAPKGNQPHELDDVLSALGESNA